MFPYRPDGLLVPRAPEPAPPPPASLTAQVQGRMAQGSSLQDAVHATQASNPLATAEQMAMAAIAAQAAQQAQQSARANTKPKQPTDLIDRATRKVADAHVLDVAVVHDRLESMRSFQIPQRARRRQRFCIDWSRVVIRRHGGADE